MAWPLVQFYWSIGLLEEERIGLLALKEAFILESNSYVRSFSTWNIDDPKRIECCDWERIRCDSTTGRVIKLSLNNLDPNAPLDEYPYFDVPEHDSVCEKRWSLNVSLLQPFKELRDLNLSHNAIGGWITNEGFKKLQRLKNLEILDLSFNCFHDSNSLQSLGAMTPLKILNLAGNLFEGYFPAQELIGLRNLEELDISFNGYNECLPMQGFEKLAVLRKLETLNLNSNSFDSSVINSISSITSLRTLRLGDNYFETSGEDFDSFSRLENLETLELGGNDFQLISLLGSLRAVKSLKNLYLQYSRLPGDFRQRPFPAQGMSPSNYELQPIPKSKHTHLDLSFNSFDKNILRCLGALPALKSLNLGMNLMEGHLRIGDLANLSTLEILDMSNNDFKGSIPPSIGSLYSLKVLSLSYNYLNGTLPTEEFCKLTKLEELDLSLNQLEGTLPLCLKNMTSLKVVDISVNQFNGNLPPLTRQTSLEYIDLSGNLFEGLFSFSSFANHSKLEVILFESGNNKLEIETEDPVGWKPLFQLKVLVLCSCNLNKHTGHNIPTFLFEQHELEEVNLSHNRLKGDFPLWLLENNERLQFLNLRNNCLTGRFGLPPDQYMQKISWIDVSENRLDGQLQENIGTISPLLNYLSLSKNNFAGNIPSSIGNWSYLEELDLSFNNFSGEVPKELIANCTSLSVLRLSNNIFQGKIFSKHFKLLNLEFLQLNDNQLTGTLPEVQIPFYGLKYLDIGNNNMSGTIPRWIGNMSLLETLSMRNNFFEGQIPWELRYMLFIDLSQNSLSGTMPSCLNTGRIEHILLQGNKLTGPIPKGLLNSSKLVTLNIRDNNFSGTIPDEIGTLENLRILLLGGNHFSGMIPNQLCQLRSISIMDLSMNFFYGKVPSCFWNISFGKVNSYYNFESLWWNNGSREFLYNYFIEKFVTISYQDATQDKPVEIQFTTKYRFDYFKTHILGYMSGLDLSCNNLTGKLPSELGQLKSLRALNLSYNQLTGCIPETLSNMNMLESLDFSHNNLTGEIPSTLVDLKFLAVFSVAHNNLSGKLPDMKFQFATFDNSSYKGNPFLCGQPLDKICKRVNGSHPTPTKFSNASDEKWYEVDPLVFSASFIFFVAVVSILYINPYWQQWCFSVIESLMYRCYFSTLDAIKRLSNRLCQ